MNIDEKILNAIIYINIYERENSNYKNILKNLLCAAPKIVDLISRFKGASCGLSINSSWEQEAIYENYISLSSNEYDDLGIKRVNLNYSVSDLTLFTMKKIIEELGKAFIDKNIGRVAGFDYLWDKKKFISDAGYHHLGGTRMGLDPKESVVDKNLKVHNVKNLFIAGSSVFPTGGAANPTLSIVQLSLRLSAFLQSKII
jgi:choline dehydrogenase-like flavoprotein